MMDKQIEYQDPVPTPTILHSDNLSEKQLMNLINDACEQGCKDLTTEPKSITKQQYEELRYSLGNASLWEIPNFRSDSRRKLADLTRAQFVVLAVDVHDEVVRATNLKHGIAFVATSHLPRAEFCQERNERRQRLANFKPNSLRDLLSDVFYELCRRFPQLRDGATPLQRSPSSLQVNRNCSVPDPNLKSGLLNLVSTTPNVPDPRVGDIIRNATAELDREAVDVISNSMPVSEIMHILERHGCPDVTDMFKDCQCDPAPMTGGGFGDVYRGCMQSGVEVAIKCLRLFTEDGIERAIVKEAARELYIWSKHAHPNITQLFGVAHFQGRIAMVSPWMSNGNLTQYLARFPYIDRLRICHEIACGVEYLHSTGSVHGDIKGLNVLISDSGSAKLTDFGNSTLNNNTLQFTGSSPLPALSIRWAAPELLMGSDTYSAEADIYALAMEVVSGKMPFYEIRNEPAVIARVIVQKKHPERPCACMPPTSPQGDILWELLTRCWINNPLGRPTASNFRMQIGAITQEGLRDYDRDKRLTYEAYNQQAAREIAEVTAVAYAQTNKLANMGGSELGHYSELLVDQEASAEPHDTAGAIPRNTARGTSYMANTAPQKARGEQRAGKRVRSSFSPPLDIAIKAEGESSLETTRKKKKTAGGHLANDIKLLLERGD
ncbi:hypothetical protein FRC09_012357 [Ceratobasidium sp. 395]|nr:hypothetical protein FRC09_012357 [Ceratobasidium sp. 395]